MQKACKPDWSLKPTHALQQERPHLPHLAVNPRVRLAGVKAFAPSIAGLTVGIVAGYVCTLLHTPLPWMIGPLFSVATLRVLGMDISAPRGARQGGQWIIGTSLGLYFTPVVVHAVARLWWVLALAALFAVVVGYVTAMLLARLAKIDRTTALFASVPGGAMEMSMLGERFGARVDRVAAAQSLRILLVIGIVPASFALLGMHGLDPYLPGSTAFDAAGLAILLAATFVGSLIASRMRVPNAFVLGSLALAIPLTAGGVNLSAVPQVVTNGAQCLLGCALGSRFGPEFLHGAHRFVGAVVASVVVGIALSALFGVGLAWSSGTDPATAGARHGTRRHCRDVHHGESPATGGSAGDRLSRDACGGGPACDGAVVRSSARDAPRTRATRCRRH